MIAVRELSPPGPGGVSVLSVEGPGALERVRVLAPRLGARPGPVLVRLSSEGEALDEALALVHDDERVELHLHGSPPLVARVRALLDDGATAVEPERLEDRAWRRLESAPGEAAARILLDQAEGALRRDLEDLHAAADRPRFADRLAALRERGRIAARALVPARVVLAGPTNAGKSTLFNALCGTRRVLVSTRPGTTRDAVAERVRLGAWPVDLVDTAGERPIAPGGLGEHGAAAGAAGRVEARGMAIGRTLRAAADLVLWLRPADRAEPELAERAPAGAVVVESRADLAPAGAGPGGAAGAPPSISAVADPERAARVCAELFREHLHLPAKPWTPGAGVPFEPRLLDGLAELASVVDPSRRRAALEAWLGR